MRQLPFWARGPGADRGPEPALLFLALIAAACLPSSRYSVGNAFFVSSIMLVTDSMDTQAYSSSQFAFVLCPLLSALEQ